MKISITGAEIIEKDGFYSILYKNQLIINGLAKEVAVGIALNSARLNMLQESNKSDNIYYLKVA